MSVLVQRNLHRNNQIDTLDIQMVAMTNSQFINNNNNSINSSSSGSSTNNNNCVNNLSTNNNINNNNNNNNNDGEPKYLHKKFKKMATAEMVSPAEIKNENTIPIATPPVSSEMPTKKRDITDFPKNIKESSKSKETTTEFEGEHTETKKTGYVCPYCKLSCAKPSVLQKHIRAHTNERPYPCVLCGFAFKTKSNLYKHCRSRAHVLKMEGGGDTGKVSEDSDISLSDSASNGTGTPPPTSTVTSANAVSNAKIVKTGKIYKPKFHTALQCVNNDADVSLGPPTSIPPNNSTPSIPTSSLSVSTSSSSSSSTTVSTISKSNVEQLQEHIDKIITDNQAIVEAVDPRLHKLVSQRQQSIVEQHKPCEQPLNLSSSELVDDSSRKRCYSESFVIDDKEGDSKKQQNFQGSIIKDLLLKNRGSTEPANESFFCSFCKIFYASADNLETHRKYYCKRSSSSPKHDLQLTLEKKDDFDNNKSEYYSTIQPLPSPGPLLGNTRLVDASYTPSKKHKPDLTIPTSLRSLEELSKYPRPNSLQMFGGEVRILDNTGETKTMRIEPRQTNSPISSDDLTINQINQKGVSSETSSIVVRSGLHSGGTMVHKPPGTPVTTSSSSISLPNTPKMLAPIIPNISTPNLAPTMSSCYNYFESHMANSSTNITAYNSLQTLPQSPASTAGITTILHGGKVIPYVPGIPGPHSLTTAVPVVDHVIQSSSPSVQQSTADLAANKITPTTFHVATLPTQQPLDLASSIKFQPHSLPKSTQNLQINHHNNNSHLNPPVQPLDLVNSTPPTDSKTIKGFKHSSNGFVNLKVPPKLEEKFKNRGLPSNSTPATEFIKNDMFNNDNQHHQYVKSGQVFKYQSADSHKEINDKILKAEKSMNYLNGGENSGVSSKYITENRKRSGNWSDSDYFSQSSSIDSLTTTSCISATKVESSLLTQENGKVIRVLSDDFKNPQSYGNVNGNSRAMYAENVTPVVIINLDSSKVSSIDPELSKSDSSDNVMVYDDKFNSKKVKMDKLDTDKKYMIDEKEEEEKENETEEEKMNRVDNKNNHQVSVKFLRPTSLPLKPGTFTPKKHHGITPTANTLPLISPETPRPRKSYGQLYLNGHAYTYLGLKCSTRVFYCTLNRPQPMYVIQQHGLSMYSNWKICKEAPPDLDMAHYDSRNRSFDYTIAWKKQDVILTHSSQRPTTLVTNNSADNCFEENDATTASIPTTTTALQSKNKRIKIFDGGFKSNEDYTYVRGRGRGRYVCEECGIRCKKPSMLKKHIRTHTDVRPYTCKHCTFSFKTKGNLTKHMKSKAHYKKCVELGINPVPTVVCDDNIDKEAIAKLVAAGGDNVADESSEEEDETDVDESDESGNEEQEAAQSLLSLSQPNSHQIRLPGLTPVGRPSTYPYTLTDFQINKSSNSSSVVTTTTNTTSSNSSLSVVTSTTLIQSEAVTNRYYFPSSKSLEDCRDSVIRSTKLENDVEIDAKHASISRYQSLSSSSLSSSSSSASSSPPLSSFSQPMDLTTKTSQLPVQLSSTSSSPSSSPSLAYIKRPILSDMFTPVSEPILMQTIVQTMERLPLQGKEWKPDNANGHMLQAYLTERHVMDSKMKQQYRIGSCNSKLDKKQITYSNVDFVDYSHNSVIIDRSCALTNTVSTAGIIYADPNSRMQQLVLTEMAPTRKEDNVKVETTCEKHAGDIDLLYVKKSHSESTLVHDDVNSSIDNHLLVDINKRSNEQTNNYTVEKNGPTSNQQSKNEIGMNQDNALSSKKVNNNDNSHQIPKTLNDSTEIFDRSTAAGIQLTINEMKDYHHIDNSDGKFLNNSKKNDLNHDNSSGSNGSRSNIRNNNKNNNIIIINNNNGDYKTDFKIKSNDEISPMELTKISEISKPSFSIGDLKNSERTDLKINIDLPKQCSIDNALKQNVARKMIVGGPGFRSPSPSRGNLPKPQAEFLQPSSGHTPNYVSITEDGRSVCGICNKIFSKPSQLRLHINIHYFERPFRCESCAVSFRTKGHLTKHERSVSHHNKVSMTSTFGAATTSNPRPFKCTDCKIAFRIHGHLAKHLRSKMHIMKLECLGKLPFGTYAEMERSGVNLNDIDTTDCDNSLASLQMLAQKLYEKDPSKMGQWDAEVVPHQGTSGGETSSDEGEPIPSNTIQQTQLPYIPLMSSDISVSRAYQTSNTLVSGNDINKPVSESHVPNLRFDDNNSSASLSLPYKCQMCEKTLTSVNELRVHCFVEHNIEYKSIQSDCGKENAQNKKMIELIAAVPYDDNKQKNDTLVPKV